ncbi:MAG: hypothetical protein JXP34_27970 [Planctomycetes bacterium]|nr:hypothetical protein [Planctomycetota bacterium]
MRIDINGRADLAAATPDTPLGEVLDGIRRFAAEEGLRVGAIRLDGEPLGPAEEAERRDAPTGGFARLEVQLELCPDPATGGAPAPPVDPGPGIRAACERIERAGDLLARGKRREALVEIAAAAEGLPGLLRARGVDPAWLAETKGVLDRLNQAIAAGDDVAAADQLVYELAPRLRTLEGTCSP